MPNQELPEQKGSWKPIVVAGIAGVTAGLLIGRRLGKPTQPSPELSRAPLEPASRPTEANIGDLSLELPQIPESILAGVIDFKSGHTPTINPELNRFLEDHDQQPSHDLTIAWERANEVITIQFEKAQQQAEEKVTSYLGDFGLAPKPDFQSPFDQDNREQDLLTPQNALANLEAYLWAGASREEVNRVVEGLAIAHIRANGIEALERYLELVDLPLPEITISQPEELARLFLSHLDGSFDDASEFLNIAFNSQVREFASADEYAGRVKEFCDQVQELEDQVDPIETFQDVLEVEEKIKIVAADKDDLLVQVGEKLHNAAANVAARIVAEYESEETGESISRPQEPPRPEKRGSSTWQKIAAGLGIWSAGVTGAYADHIIFHRESGQEVITRSVDQIQKTILSDLSRHEQEQYQKLQEQYKSIETQINGLRQDLGKPQGRAIPGTGQEQGHQQPAAKPQRSSELTLEQAKKFIDLSDGRPDGQLTVKIAKAQGTGSMDTLDWAVGRQNNLFDPKDPTKDGAARWRLTAAAIADQGKTPQDYRLVHNGDQIVLAIGDQQAEALIKADLPLPAKTVDQVFSQVQDTKTIGQSMVLNQTDEVSVQTNKQQDTKGQTASKGQMSFVNYIGPLGNFKQITDQQVATPTPEGQTPTPTATSTDIATPQPTATETPISTPTNTPHTPTPVSIETSTATATSTITSTGTPVPTLTPIPTETPLPTSTPASTPLSTPMPTETSIPTPTETFHTPTPVPVETSTPTPTPFIPGGSIPTETPIPTPTVVFHTPTPVPQETSTPTPTGTPLSTETPIPTPTETFHTPTPVSTETPVPTPTVIFHTPTPVATETPTSTPTATFTPTATSTSTPTPTETPRPTQTITATSTSTRTATSTATPTSTFTPVPSVTSSPTSTPKKETPTPSPTPSPIRTPSPTPVPKRKTPTPTPPPPAPTGFDNKNYFPPEDFTRQPDLAPVPPDHLIKEIKITRDSQTIAESEVREAPWGITNNIQMAGRWYHNIPTYNVPRDGVIGQLNGNGAENFDVLSSHRRNDPDGYGAFQLVKDLDQVQKGDEATLTRANGSVEVYQVTKVLKNIDPAAEIKMGVVVYYTCNPDLPDLSDTRRDVIVFEKKTVAPANPIENEANVLTDAHADDQLALLQDQLQILAAQLHTRQAQARWWLDSLWPYLVFDIVPPFDVKGAHSPLAIWNVRIGKKRKDDEEEIYIPEGVR